MAELNKVLIWALGLMMFVLLLPVSAVGIIGKGMVVFCELVVGRASGAYFPWARRHGVTGWLPWKWGQYGEF